MAIQWGAWSGGSGAGGFRVGIDAAVSGVNITPAYFVQTGSNSVADSQRLTRTGALSGTYDYTFNASGTPPLQKWIGSWSMNGTPGSTYYFGASLSGIYSGATPSVSVSVTLPLGGPNTPGTPTLTRLSDTSTRVQWVNNSPQAGQWVHRSEWRPGDVAWRDFVNVGAAGVGATTFTDNGCAANRWYRYRVVASQAGLDAYSPVSNQIGTTPAAPAGLSATRDGTGVTVTGTRQDVADGSTWFEWQQSLSSGAWTDVAGTTTTPTRTFAAEAPAGTLAYRSRARILAQSPSLVLYSDWSASSNVINLLAAPGAPILGGAFNTGTPAEQRVTGVVDRRQQTTLPFTHQAVDTTIQQAAQLRWRLNGGAWTTYTFTTQSEANLAVGTLAVVGTLEWQARTRGAHADYGPWSAIQSVTVTTRSTATITAPPAGTLAMSRLTLTWAHFNETGTITQVEWRARLIRANVTIQELTGTGTATQATFTVPLDDATAYTGQVEVRGSNGLWSAPSSRTFTTSFPLPYPGTVDATFDRATGANALTVTVDTSIVGRVAVNELDIDWWNADAERWETVATSIPPSSSTPHALPYLGENRYRAITRNLTLPSETVGDVSVQTYIHDRCPVYVNTGDGWGTVVTAITNNINDTATREATLYEWAGVTLPSSIYGPHRGRRIEVDGSLRDPERASAPTQWRNALHQARDVWYRDCGERDGHGPRRVHGMLTITGAPQTGRHINGIRFTIDQTSED